MSILLLFIILTFLNVFFSTIKSILTIKGNKWVASCSNALYYGFYNLVLIITVDPAVGMLEKVIITAIANLLCVFTVKLIEEKLEKEKLFKIEFTASSDVAIGLDHEMTLKEVPHSYIMLSEKYCLFNCYCATKNQSREVREVVKKYNARYFVTEGRPL